MTAPVDAVAGEPVAPFGLFMLHEDNDQWGAYQVSSTYARDPRAFPLYATPPRAGSETTAPGQEICVCGDRPASECEGAEVVAPVLSPDTVIEFQTLEDHLERWARGECLATARNGYDDPWHRAATIRDVTKALASMLPRFKKARAALLKFAVEYEQFKGGTYTPEDEGAGWPFPSSGATPAAPSQGAKT